MCLLIPLCVQYVENIYAKRQVRAAIDVVRSLLANPFLATHPHKWVNMRCPSDDFFEKKDVAFAGKPNYILQSF
jgi:hypothetical protein